MIRYRNIRIRQIRKIHSAQNIPQVAQPNLIAGGRVACFGLLPAAVSLRRARLRQSRWLVESRRRRNQFAVRQTAILYAIIIAIAAVAIPLSLEIGNRLMRPAPVVSSFEPGSTSTASDRYPMLSLRHAMMAGLERNATSSLGRLFLQLFVIIIVSSAMGWLFTRCGQPAVVGEMMAGVMLGPSLFGLLTPQAFQFVFAPASLDALRLFSQIGVCLFMFAVGMELDLSHLRHNTQKAFVIGHGSIVIPYLFGVVLAAYLYNDLAGPGASFVAFGLVMGISMSITAFPVLVRILQDRGIFYTSLGATATACAAVNDVTAWCILAFVVAIASAVSVGAAAMSLGLVLIYVAAMLLIVQPLLPRWLRQFAAEDEEPSKGVLATVLAVVVLSSLCTEVIGIHALFGAFLAGIIMPAAGGFRDKLVVRVEHLSTVLLLPLFFAFIGLRTHIGLWSGGRDWGICLLIITVATFGKLGGTALVSRALGLAWRESLQLGALMNTRGLMELIALNIGYDLGVLSQRIFTMLVVMALFTTFMTGPLLSLFGNRTRRA